MSYWITRTGTYAFNRETGERMEQPKWPDHMQYAHNSEWLPAYYRYVSAMKVWDAFVEALPYDYGYKRHRLTHATEKGVPVPRTGCYGRRKYVNGSGVSANSRVLSHRYRDEGEKGKILRREIKRKERALWRSEATQEIQEYRDYECGWTLYDPEYDDMYDEYL